MSLSRCRRRALAACVLAALPLACASLGPTSGRPGSPAPAWVEERYAGVDSGRVLSGVASAPGISPESEDRARRSAMRRINEDIMSRVKSELTTASRELARSSGSEATEEWQRDISERIEIASEGELPAANAEPWVDTVGNQTWVRVTADRELLVTQLLQPVEESLAAAQGLLAGLQAGAGDLAQELTITLKAYNQVAATLPGAVRATAAARTGSGRDASPAARRAGMAYQQSEQLLGNLSEAVAQIAPRLRIDKLGGDAQQGMPRGRLALPLVGRVSVEDAGGPRGLGDVPVRFRSELDGARVPTLAPSGSTTGADGSISCEVADLIAGRQGQGVVVLEIDVEGLGPSRLADTLPSARFVYSVATASQTAVAVAIESRYEGALLPGTDPTAVVAAHLTGAGFRAAARPGIVGLPLPALQQTLDGEFQYAIRGELSTRRGTRDGQFQHFVAEGRLEVIDLATGAVMATLSPEPSKGVSGGDIVGARRAAEGLLRKVLTSLDTEFIAAFGS